MSRKIIGMFAAAMFAASTAVAAPISINFGDYAPGTAITDQIAGVCFSLMGGPHSAGAPVTGGFGGIGLTNSTTTDYPTAAILNVDFDGVARNVSFTFFVLALAAMAWLYGETRYIVLVIIGTALDLTPTILIFAPVMLPIAVKAGIDPVYFGLMFILNGAIGLITPPVGTVLNVVAGVGRLPMHQVIKGVNPFLLSYTLVLALFVLFPQIVTAPVAWMR